MSNRQLAVIVLTIVAVFVLFKATETAPVETTYGPADAAQCYEAQHQGNTDPVACAVVPQ